MINSSLARVDRNAARGLGLTTPAAAATVAKAAGAAGGTSEAERRGKECLRLGDTAVRDEDELEKAVRWYLAGLAALQNTVAAAAAGGGGSSEGAGAGGRMQLPTTQFAARRVPPVAKSVTVAELLYAQLDGRLDWVRRRHRDGVAAGVRHNATVALRAGQRELANCWQMLQALVTRDGEDEDEDDEDDDDKGDENDSDAVYGGTTRESDDRTSRMELPASTSAASSGAAASAAAVASAAGTAAAMMDRNGLLDGLFGSSVERLASWFAERRGEADLQSAVTLLLLVGRPFMWGAFDAIADLWPPYDPAEEAQAADQAGGPSPPHPSQLKQLQGKTGYKTGSGRPRPRYGSSSASTKGAEAHQQQEQRRPQQSRALTWCHAYIELLQRHKLDTVAILVSHLSQCIPIQKLNQDRVHFKAVSKCLSCKTEMPTAPGSAAKEAGSHCNSPACIGENEGGAHFRLGFVNARCSICRLPVRGPWVWCQGCGHGGHLDCYEGWFGVKLQPTTATATRSDEEDPEQQQEQQPKPPSAQRRLCPTGCNHLCNLVSEELDPMTPLMR
jgi:hypothetical protein